MAAGTYSFALGLFLIFFCSAFFRSFLVLCLSLLYFPLKHTTAPSCSNGLAGYESAGVCCPVECGGCGGAGCSDNGKECCASDVKATEVVCSDSMAAPCIIDTDSVGESTLS